MPALQPGTITLVAQALAEAGLMAARASYIAGFAGTAAGLETAEALQKGTLVFVISQTMALMWAPIMGLINDRVNRVTAIVCGSIRAIIDRKSVG